MNYELERIWKEVVDVQAEIRTEHLPNMDLECDRYAPRCLSSLHECMVHTRTNESNAFSASERGTR
jgi:hypothetical protein